MRPLLRQGATRHAVMPPDVYADGPGMIAKVRPGGTAGTSRRRCAAGCNRAAQTSARSLLRAEGRTLERRCLIIANDFYLRPGLDPNRTHRRVEIITSDRFFCFAGTWRPETATWPAAFAGITVEAYPDIEPYQDRHMAVVRKSDWRAWLSGEASEGEILRPFPFGSFSVSGAPERARMPGQPERPAAGDLFG